jgi:hypothetical protein
MFNGAYPMITVVNECVSNYILEGRKYRRSEVYETAIIMSAGKDTTLDTYVPIGDPHRVQCSPRSGLGDGV